MTGNVAGVEAIHSPPTRLDKFSGIRVTSGRPQDLHDGKTCHQCRQKIRDFGAACTNQKKIKPCAVRLCRKCLLNRYGEKADEISALQGWICPKCRGICNCSVCMKKKGQTPTGALIKTAKATGFDSVSEMLLKGTEWSTTKISPSTVLSPRKDGLITAAADARDTTHNGEADNTSPKHLEMNSQDIDKVLNGKMDHNTSCEVISQITDKRKVKKKDILHIHDERKVLSLPNDENFSNARKMKHLKLKHSRSDKACVRGAQKKRKILRENLDGDGRHCMGDVSTQYLIRKHDLISEDGSDDDDISLGGSVGIQMPHGNKMASICGILVRAEDAGNALQFLEFCVIFAKILNLRKGQAENVLRDLLHGRFSRHGRFSVVAQFIIQLLSFIQTEQERGEKLNLSASKVSWYQAAKKILFKSQTSVEAEYLDALEKAADFEALDVSLKIRVLNLLCDEVLETKMMRNWIDKQNRQLTVRMKETKLDLAAARDKEATLRMKLKDNIANAGVPQSGFSPSKPEQDLVISNIKYEVKEAHAQVIQLKAKLMEFNETQDAVRVEPILRGGHGQWYWKLNCLGKSTIVHQELGRGDSLSLDDQWFVLGHEEKEAVEEFVSSRRGNSSFSGRRNTRRKHTCIKLPMQSSAVGHGYVEPLIRTHRGH